MLSEDGLLVRTSPDLVAKEFSDQELHYALEYKINMSNPKPLDVIISAATSGHGKELVQS